MNRSLRPCLQPGCVNLVKSGYCHLHKSKNKNSIINHVRIIFDKLSKKKSPEDQKFYSSAAWHRTSKLYRLKHPLCERCKQRGLIKASQMVHHVINLHELRKEKRNPLSWKYLQALCNNCHLEDLRGKKREKRDNKEKKAIKY